MPRIAKWAERQQCVIQENKYVKVIKVPDQYKDIAAAYKNIRYSDLKNLESIMFNKLEEMINAAIKEAMKPEWFDQFVDVKEVPYGRYNSDSDYRGS